MARFFDALNNSKHLALLITAYAADLRLSEVARLRVEPGRRRRVTPVTRRGDDALPF
jgi:hypothetical protein